MLITLLMLGVFPSPTPSHPYEDWQNGHCQLYHPRLLHAPALLVDTPIIAF
jgi:hypothetical protein